MSRDLAALFTYPGYDFGMKLHMMRSRVNRSLASRAIGCSVGLLATDIIAIASIADTTAVPYSLCSS